MIQGYKNMADTCAPNKWWSDGISDLEELRSWDCGMELRRTKQQKVCHDQLVLFRNSDGCQKAHGTLLSSSFA